MPHLSENVQWQMNVNEAQAIAMNAAEGSASNARSLARWERSSVATLAVRQLPSRTQITFGGWPMSRARCWKSTSFKAMTNPCAAACAQTAGSDARARLKSRTCAEPGNSAANCPWRLHRQLVREVLIEEKLHAVSKASRGRDGPQPALAVGGVGEARPNVLRRQIGKVIDDLGRRHPRGQVFQHVPHRHPKPANAGLPAPLVRLDRDEVPVVHHRRLRRARPGVNCPPGSGDRKPGRMRSAAIRTCPASDLVPLRTSRLRAREDLLVGHHSASIPSNARWKAPGDFCGRAIGR